MTPHDSPPLGRVLMVQGTSSHAGKTTVVAALCRWFANAGYRVAPYKAQNMSNNAAVTALGEEVGRAQAMQATAARTTITVDMNPVLLKPQSDRTSQVVVLGKPWRTADATDYYARKAQLWPIVTDALDRLRAAYDIVIIEGAGSPAEINLAQYDIVNMRVARHANAPVLLVGDIERGGVFASLYGTYALLTAEERSLIRAFVINKFRGDPTLLDPGFAMLKERTGVPTIGVLPWFDLRDLPQEDALEWAAPRDPALAEQAAPVLDIAIMRLPRIANLDEFQPLLLEPGVRTRFVGDAQEFGSPDLVIIPGTKSTVDDLQWMRERGLAERIVQHRAHGRPVLGICGGYQMLGEELVDPSGVERRGTARGLGLLPVRTEFATDKVTRRVQATTAETHALWSASTAQPIRAYEIHMGRTAALDGATVLPAAFQVTPADSTETTDDGACSLDGLVVGTYLHGALENAPLRHAMLAQLAERKGVALPEPYSALSLDDALDRLATVVGANLDMPAILHMLDLPAKRA
ncbi:MAG: cobyric acid synthase [Gemmatimonadaceae bacterium]|nr:cobyric acid synthase [Gemmatimonadaceae bacterium]